MPNTKSMRDALLATVFDFEKFYLLSQVQFLFKENPEQDVPGQSLWNLTISPVCLAFPPSAVVYPILLSTENCDELGHIYKAL